jgi:RimJ/RimL family protein N-acetyltransferase
MDIAPMTAVSEADETIGWAMRLLDANKGVRWAIRDRAGAFAGAIGFNSLVREHGYWRGRFWDQQVFARLSTDALSRG